MTVNKTTDGASAVYKVAGRLETITAPELDSVIKEDIDGVSAITFDFSELEYISSAGLRVLLSAQKKIAPVGGKIKILNPNDIVLEIFEVTGFADIFDIANA